MTESTLAYRSDELLDSDDGRPLRILSEYLGPLRAFRRERVHDTIVFFGSARLREDGPLGRYYDDARELARRITEWSLSLPCEARRFVVCTGGGGGIMEAANRGAREAGGRTIGLNIGLPHEQRPNSFVTPELSFEFHYFFTRKYWFLYLCKALVIFPGGFGTMDELFETLTLVQTGKIKKKLPIVLYGKDYWTRVINLEAMAEFGTISPGDLDLIHVSDSVDDAYAYLTSSLEGGADGDGDPG